MPSQDPSQPNYDLAWLAGGAALILFGAGVLASNPKVRELASRVLPKSPDGSDLSMENLAGILPDIERYIRIRSM